MLFSLKASATTPVDPDEGVTKPPNLPARLPWEAGTSVGIGWGYGVCNLENLSLGDHCNGDGSSQDYYALDFWMDEGDSVYPIADGTVLYAGDASGGWDAYGKIVYIEHVIDEVHYQSLYTHLSEISVGTGPITSDTALGEAGHTGTDADHLHFALYRGAQFCYPSTCGGSVGPYGGQAVLPEPLVGREVHEGFGLTWDGNDDPWDGPLEAEDFGDDSSPGPPGGSWGGATPSNDTSIGRNQSIRFDIVGLPDDTKEVRLTVGYGNWSIMGDTIDSQVWRVLARCWPDRDDEDDCNWNGISSLYFEWRPHDENNPDAPHTDAPWLPSGTGVNVAYDASQTRQVCISFDVFDEAGNVTYSPSGTRCTNLSNGSPSSPDEASNLNTPEDNTARLLYIEPHNSPDSTPPNASGFNVAVSGGLVTLEALSVTDNPGGVGVNNVSFSAKWPSHDWIGIGSDTTSPYSLSWNLCGNLVPDGEVELGMEVLDRAGNKFVWSEGGQDNPRITKSFNCNPPEGITLIHDDGRRCTLTQDAPSVGNYAQSHGCGSDWNDKVVAIDTNGPFYFILFEGDNYGGNHLVGNFSGSLDVEWKTKVSSIRIRKSSPAHFTLYPLGDYNPGGEGVFASDRSIMDLGTWGYNDTAESIGVEPGYEVIVCSGADLREICGRTKEPVPDLNALAEGLRNTVSSVRVCQTSCLRAPTALPIRPLDEGIIAPGDPVVFRWATNGDEHLVEYWGGELQGTYTSGWINGTIWSPGNLPESSEPYYWHVRSWSDYGVGDWSPQSSFYVRTARIAGDIDDDGVVGIYDYSIMIAAFGTSPPSHPGADLDGDGAVTIFDYNIVITNFGAGVSSQSGGRTSPPTSNQSVPSQPSNVSISYTFSANQKALLSADWLDNSNDENGFEVSWFVDGYGSNTVITSADVESIRPSLLPQIPCSYETKTYITTVSVKAFNSDGASESTFGSVPIIVPPCSSIYLPAISGQ